MLTQKDEGKIQDIVKTTVVQAMTEVMMPVLDKIMKTQDEHTKDIVEMKEELSDVHLTANRIETLQKHELNRVDNHGIRIGKLENKIA